MGQGRLFIRLFPEKRFPSLPRLLLVRQPQHDDVADGQDEHGQNEGQAFAFHGADQFFRGLEQFRMPFADPVAVPGEHGAPGEGAERGDQGKHAESHADDARRDGDQVADDGEKARKKDPGHFITLQEKFRLLHLVGRHEKEFAPSA